MHRIECGHFKYEGHSLAYEQHGPDSGTPLLLMHGILLDSAINRDLAEPLVQAGYRVILLDLLGHGRSDKAKASELRTEFFSDQVIACLDHLGIEKTLLGGISLGAMVSLQVAAVAPDRLSGLWLEMPVMEKSTVFAAVLLAPIVFATHYLPWLFRPLASAMRKMPRPRRGIYESALNAAGQEPEAIKAILHGVLVGPVVPPRRVRRNIAIPTLVIGHKGDWLHNLGDARALAEEIPNARLLVANSILELRTRPQRLMPEIISFLDQASGKAPTHAVAMPFSEASPTAAAAGEADLESRFRAAVEKVRSAPGSGPVKPSNEMKLTMYALFRQAQDGDVTGKRPGMMDVVSRYKYDAWAAVKGLSREEAMRRYIAEIGALEKKYA